MHSHIVIKGEDGTLALKPDTSLDITEKNPMFSDVEMFSQPIALPFEANRRLLGNIDDIKSSMKSADIQNKRFQIIVDGVPLRSTAIKVQSDTALKDTIDVNFDSTNRTFKDMISEMNCRDVTVDSDILIGEKIGDVEVTMQITEMYKVYLDFAQDKVNITGKTTTDVETFQPTGLGFSYPGKCYQDANFVADINPDSSKAQRVYPNPNAKDNGGGGDIIVKVPHVQTSYINTSQPYPAARYCNSRVCYPHYEAGRNDNGEYTGETSDKIVPSTERKRGILEDKSPYWVLDADRPMSGICFYVGYFLERLFKTLGVAYDISALTNIEDFNYLCFFTTQCHYDTGDSLGTLNSVDAINAWLESRGCGGKMSTNDNNSEKRLEYYNGDKWNNEFKLLPDEYTNIEYDLKHPEHPFDIRESDGSIHLYNLWKKLSADHHMYYYYMSNFRWFDVQTSMTAHILPMYANSDNFPDVSVTEVIQSLENAFGVRFCYDAEINKVTVNLMRDMLRDTQEPVSFKGTVLDIYKRTDNVRGVRMKYSAESDKKDQQSNIRNGVRDYDTNYDYVDYRQGRVKFATFEDVTEKIDVGNMNGYCDMRNGNYYRVKVNSDAKAASELQPAVFEVGAMHGVEVGDCSDDAEQSDAIKEFVCSFLPISVNDVAFRGKNYDEQEDPLMVPFIDEDMEHEFLIKKLLNPVSTKWGSIDIIYELCLSENYDPSGNEDGQSPLQSHDWGLTVGFLRPGSSGEDIVNYEQNYDGFGNSKWLITSSNYCLNADSFDQHGNFIGVNPQTSFSLKPRAYKPFRYKYDGDELLISTNPEQWEEEDGWLIPCNSDTRSTQGFITERIASRGLCDTFMIELFKLLIEGRKYRIEALCSVAELADIPKKWLRRWDIDGMVGWIEKFNYSATAEKGIGRVTIDFFAI